MLGLSNKDIIELQYTNKSAMHFHYSGLNALSLLIDKAYY